VEGLKDMSEQTRQRAETLKTTTTKN
jgi:hypothetical protein